jgi:hypothetical protein
MNGSRLAAFCVGRLFGLRTMSDIWNRSWEFLLLLLQQFAGEPGLPENNLVRFGLLEHDPAMAAMIVAAIAFLSVNQLGIFILQISQIVFRKPISLSFVLDQGSQSAFTRART